MTLGSCHGDGATVAMVTVALEIKAGTLVVGQQPLDAATRWLSLWDKIY